MVDLENVLEVFNTVVIIPVSIISFALLVYTTIFLWKNDPDTVRSKLFLNYIELRKAFSLLAIMAFVLILHVSLLYIPDYFSVEIPGELQPFFGLILATLLMLFTYKTYRVVK